MTSTPKIPEGFIPWAGGECPVPGDMRVSVMFGDGYSDNSGMAAKFWEWSWYINPDARIIAYRPDPNYVAPIDWQAKGEALRTELGAAYETTGRVKRELETELATLRAKAEKLAAALESSPCPSTIFGDNTALQCITSGHCGCDNLAALSEWEGKP